MKRYFQTVFVSLLLAGLSACATNQNPLLDVQQQANDPLAQKRWLAHRDEAATIDHWRIKGKISVKAGSKGGHATLRWGKTPITQHIELFGPLGSGRVEIDADEQGARLQDTKGGTLRGNSIARLIEQRLGWPLPFDQLPSWLRGLPTSDEAQMEWDEQGRIVRMNDQQWQVSYPEYHLVSVGAGEKISVPRKIELNALPGTLRVYDKKGVYLGDEFFVRLIIQSWLP